MPAKDTNIGKGKQEYRCLYCGSRAGIVWVHGHGQCANCGINTEECCRGEQCRSTETVSDHSSRAL